MRSIISPLAKTVLTGNRRWEWLPLLIARVSLGLFFALSGHGKLFVPERHEDLVLLMTDIGIPFPGFMATFLASVEFFGGLFLIVGFLSTFWAIALTIAMIVAIVTVEIDLVIPKGIGFLEWIGWFLYLPQVMYVILFFWLMITGPGQYSVDNYLAKKMGLGSDA